MDPAEAIKHTILELVLRRENVYVLAATWSLLAAVNKMLPQTVGHPWAARFAPLLPVLLCSLFVWLPGLQTIGLAAGERILIGLILGGAAGWGHKFYAQTIRGRDDRIKKDRS